MPSSLPEQRPRGVDDNTTLRFALRSDGRSGFLFVAWHQPHEPLPHYRDAQFRVALDDGDLLLPSLPVESAGSELPVHVSSVAIVRPVVCSIHASTLSVRT